MNDTKKSILSISLVILLVVATLAVSYAYFTAFISGNESVSTISVTAGRMTLAFADNSTDVTIKNDIYPRAKEWVTKSFSITGTNTTDLNMYYKISMVIDNNTFSNNALSYTFTGSKATGDNGVLITDAGKNISGTTTIQFGNGASGYFTTANALVHTYTLKIFFKDTGNPQNQDQNAKFAAHIVISAANA